MQYVIANATRDTLIARTKEGISLRSTNMMAALKSIPLAGEWRSNSIETREGELIVRFGRGYAKVDKRSGGVFVCLKVAAEGCAR